MSSNSVQSFMIDICNGLPNENGLHNVCLAPVLPYLYVYVGMGLSGGDAINKKFSVEPFRNKHPVPV